MRTISEDTKKQFIAEYLKYPVPLTKLCKQFNMCAPTASKVLKDCKIPIYTKQQLCDLDVRSDYFSKIDSELKAYLLGFLLADGCIYENNTKSSYRVILELKFTDAYIVDLFKQALNTNSCIVIDKRHNSEFHSCAITNNQIALDLISLGVCVGKPNRHLPSIDKDLLPHLLRGLFDGDGCITYRRAHPYGESYTGRVNIVGFEYVINDVAKLYDVIGISNYSINSNNSNELLAIDVRRFADVQLFYDYVYADANFYLNRKKEKFEEYFKLKNKM